MMDIDNDSETTAFVSICCKCRKSEKCLFSNRYWTLYISTWVKSTKDELASSQQTQYSSSLWCFWQPRSQLAKGWMDEKKRKDEIILRGWMETTPGFGALILCHDCLLCASIWCHITGKRWHPSAWSPRQRQAPPQYLWHHPRDIKIIRCICMCVREKER